MEIANFLKLRVLLYGLFLSNITILYRSGMEWVFISFLLYFLKFLWTSKRLPVRPTPFTLSNAKVMILLLTIDL